MEPHEIPPDDIDQQIRINELRETARELSGDAMTSWESENTPPEVAEQFWQHVVDYETAEQTCQFKQLTERGLTLPPAEELDEPQLSDKLWELINELAKLDSYLSNTDHLSDRELYKHLTEESLWEFAPDLPPGSGWTTHIDILGAGSDEDIYLYLKHYADEDYRERWLKDFPEDPMPEHVDPPHDRDRRLPKSEY